MSAEARVGFTGFLSLGFGRVLRDDILLLGSGREEGVKRRKWRGRWRGEEEGRGSEGGGRGGVGASG